MEIKKETKKKLLTVCIICFNDEKYIGETLDSLLASSYKSFDIHIFDDVSTDRTIDRIKPYLKKYNNIFLHRNKVNLGPMMNANQCLSVVKTKYLKVMCDDDILYKDCLADQVKALEKFSDVVLVYSASNVIDGRSRILFRRRFYSKDRKINGGVLINKVILTGRNPIGEPTGVMLRSSVIKENKLFFDKNWLCLSDLYLWIQVLQFGKAYFCSTVHSAFRLHEGQSTRRVLKRTINEHMMLFLKYKEEYGLSWIDYFCFYAKLMVNYWAKIIILFLVR